MRARSSLLPLSFFVLTALYGCPRCEFDETCDGNTLMTCSVGVDQQVGSPSEATRPCVGENPVCITVDATNALCGIAEARTCTADAAPKCEGGLLVTCQDNFEVAKDCVLHGNVCGEVDGLARCYAEPKVVCTGELEDSCSGTRLSECEGGLLTYRECGANTTAAKRCTSYENEYGKGAYCEG